MVISGPCDVHRYYWSIITLEGKVKSFHNFYGVGTSQTFIALNAFKSRLYISVWKDNSLHCFGLDGMKHFRFTHHDLKAPQGVSVDRDDNVYIVGCLSENIFQLSPDGSLIRIFLTRTVSKPMGICFDQNGDRFVLTHLDDTYLSFYNLVNQRWRHSEMYANIEIDIGSGHFRF
ncbi:hypothetical protein CHS0354_036242 [Potamilus streckersoni]|uniref:Uncharacterized protein n=1 Tax=Potamilus streckersoni TaxID=2493646 RepID=A0AAE0SWP8_9BIVA|nr:hypothetical protein CHS0354_036242 [Potamilus streckersoni]